MATKSDRFRSLDRRHRRVRKKVETHQATRAVIRLDYSKVRLDELRQAFRTPMTGLREYYDRAFHTILGVIQGQGIQPTGPPVGIYYSTPTETVDMAAGFPTDREVTAEAEGLFITVPLERFIDMMKASSGEP